MMQQMRVWVFTPPAGASSVRARWVSAMGSVSGRSCQAVDEANPDDPRDPCPISHIAIEADQWDG